jgi:hypothetical protein
MTHQYLQVLTAVQTIIMALSKSRMYYHSQLFTRLTRHLSSDMGRPGSRHLDYKP